jgi:hypothetical protein
MTATFWLEPGPLWGIAVLSFAVTAIAFLTLAAKAVWRAI